MRYDLAQPVPGPRIVPFGEDRLSTDVLPNGRPAFRITQRFDDVNPAFPTNGPHRATDLGNWSCGDQVYAVWDGHANTIGPDQYGALGIIIDHGDFSSVYWHLNAFSIARGTAVPVTRGQQIGIVGKTGLGAVCHLHFELKVNGVRIDPEPFLLGAPLILEDDMTIPSGGKHLVQAIALPYTRLRVTPDTADGSRVLPGSAQFVRVYEVGFKGEPYTIGGVANDLYALVGYAGEAGFAAHGALYDYGLTPAGQGAIPAEVADCSAEVAEIKLLQDKLGRVRNVIPALRDAVDAFGKVVA